MSSGRSETESSKRPPAEYHFFRSRKFFTFSPTIVAVAVAVVFSRGQGRRGGEEEFPLSPFPLLRADCVLSRYQTRHAVTRPVVCQPRREISLRGSPFVPFFFFFPALSTTKSSPMRGLRDDALLPRRARKTTTGGENPSKLDGGCVSESVGVKSRGSAASKLLSKSNCA